MTPLNEITDYLRSNLSKKRFDHSMYVAKEAKKLAVHFGADPEKCYLSGVLHDVCKEIDYELQKEYMLKSGYEISPTELNAPKTYHAIAGAYFAKEFFGVSDSEILTAIRFHTVARANMSKTEKILYMADLVSFDRIYDDVDYIRECTYDDLDRGMYEAMKFSLNYSVEHQRTIPVSTLEAYNEYMLKELERLKNVN